MAWLWPLVIFVPALVFFAGRAVLEAVGEAVGSLWDAFWLGLEDRHVTDADCPRCTTSYRGRKPRPARR